MSGRTPLRIKLSAVMLVLVAVALAVFAVSSVSVLREYLVTRVDEQIHTTATDVALRVQRGPTAFSRLRVPAEGRVEVRDREGRTILVQTGMEAEDLPGPGTVTSATPRTVPAVSGDGRWRAQVLPIEGLGTVVVAMDMAEVSQITTRLAIIELLCGVVVMAVLAVVGVVMVRRSLRPLSEIEATAAAIAQGHLGSRIPDRDPRTEVGSLARSLNGMLTQIESAFQARAASEMGARESEARMRRFIADASHELRTPLTSIRGFAELHRQVPDADTTRVMERIESEASRMGLLIEDLLLLARLDQQRPLRQQPVDLLAIAADAVHDTRTLCPDRDVSLVVTPPSREGGGFSLSPAEEAGVGDGQALTDAPSGHAKTVSRKQFPRRMNPAVPSPNLMEGERALIVSGDEERLRQVVGNLMSNATTHTPGGTPITIRVGTVGDQAFIEVADEGPGLTAEQAARVFERFYRADPSRKRPSGGSGLGLAIVDSLARAHGGSVSVRSEPGEGAAFRAVLPLAPEALS